MKSSNKNLIVKLSAFVSDYYKDRLAKGLIYGLIIISICGFIILVSEYFFHFNSLIRTLLFFGYSLFATSILCYYVLWPLLALLRIRKPIENEVAAQIIGNRISQIDDKLLNRLQLESVSDNDLVIAARNAFDFEFAKIDFANAIEKNWIKTGGIFFSIVFLLYLVTSLAKPEILSEGSKRIVEYNVAHHLIPPFNVVVDFNDTIKRGSSLDINISLSGEELPNTVEIIHNEGNYYAAKDGSVFYKQLSNIQESSSFTVLLGKYKLGPYTFTVESNPELQSGKVSFNFPEHTGILPSEVGLEKVISIPEGTRTKWKFDMVDASNGALMLDTTIQVNTGEWTNQYIANSSVSYHLVNEDDTLFNSYTLNVVKDQYPAVSMKVEEDPSSSLLFINGIASDDYGVKSINLVINDGGNTYRSIQSGKTTEEFYQVAIKLDSIKGKAEIYIEVSDNDALNGFKTSRSQIYTYIPKSADKVLEDALAQRADNTESLLKAAESIEEIKAAIENNKEKEALSNKDDWSKKHEKEEFIKSTSQLKKDLDELSSKLDDGRLDKAKELLKEIEDLLEKLDRKDDDAENLEMTLEELENEMKSNLELYKQMAFELGLEEALDRLDELADKQENLADSTLNSTDKANLQDSLNKSFDELEDRFEELGKDQKELKNIPDIDLEPKEMDEAGDEMKNASKNAKSGNSSQSKQNQQSAAKKMKEASTKMRNNLMDSREQQQQEDMETLRAIQENLLQLSFDQELIYQTQLITSINDPGYRTETVNQKQVIDDFSVVKDSLNALGERVDQLRDKISREVLLVDKGLIKSVESMEARNKSVSSQRQRESLTSMNNLALLLSEVLSQMQQQMAQSKFGDGACSKPGSGAKPKPSMSQIQAKQKALQQQMQKMKSELEKGKSKGKKGEKGEGSSGSQGDNAEQIAKMAAQQQAIREQVQRMADEAAKNGNGLSKDLKKLADEMEKNEKDILDRSIEAETLKRQEDILSKMLEVDNAMREQGQDEKREASEGFSNQEDTDILKEYLKKRENEIELLRRNNVNLQPYFKSKYSQFLNDSDK